MAKTQTPQTTEEVMRIINERNPGSVKLASDESLKVVKVATGILPFDRLIGGGVALGRWYEIYGHESVLKSVLATSIASSFQFDFPEKHVLWVDAEGSFDPEWVSRFDVDMDRINIVSNPRNGEHVIAAIETALESGLYSLVVIDSITALIPTRETEYDPEEADKAMGASGRMTSAMGRRLTRFLKNDCTIVLINQMRDNIGGMVFGADPARPTGGRAIRYYAGQRIELRRGETIKEDRTLIGASGKEQKRKTMTARMINMRVEKDKIGYSEGRQGSLLWIPREGRIDENEYLLSLGMEFGLVKRAAASVTIFPDADDPVSVRGWDNAKKYLEGNTKFKRKLRRSVSENINGKQRS